ncbi:aquaporin-8-like isoform X2 [Paramacrobiotus metropolitanus]|uniref:aquaporin-8-like isoform X2 n=1 Tax=Paramacrobiotus metropolitanus TaxID=2943436 RepID=UPI002445A56D|nr:aquaporin-8-like isoform X2 [Paramacrobiotus metropolitanus]
MEKFEMTVYNAEKRPSIAYEYAEKTWRSRLADKLRINNPLLRGSVAEFFSTFILMIFVQGTVASQIFSGQQRDVLLISIGQGMSVALAVFVSGGVSGAMLNPAVNFAFLVVGKVTWPVAIFYSIAEYMGAFVASMVIYAVNVENFDKYDGGLRYTYGPNATAGVFSTFPGEQRSVGGAFFHEAFCTVTLLVGVLAIVDERNWKPEKGLIPFAIGGLICLINLAFSYGEGMAMNPARDLAPRLFTLVTHGTEPFSFWEYNYFWIPVVGSHLGAVVGALLYVIFIEIHHPPQEYVKK